uniref:ethanolamine-phosphate cytidylyltransferase n=1 Tax=Anthurium amnicola TaxID=1678845 RepID=A0A1D1Z1U4_9ARAE
MAMAWAELESGTGAGHHHHHHQRWIWDGVHHHPHLVGLGGIMMFLTAAAFLTGIGAPYLPYLWPDLGGLLFPHAKRGAGRRRRAPVRVYMDGCFDLMHYGHANALRQAKALGDELVVGVVGDDEILSNKGPPVLSMDERVLLVSGLKWVDEVITHAPYEINEKFMNVLFNDYKIDYIIHGDDPCLLPDGTDAYALAKKAGRYKEIKRTEGVSSTDIVGRILSTMKTMDPDRMHDNASVHGSPRDTDGPHSKENDTTGSQVSHFLPTSRRIVQFSNAKGPQPNARVVYIDGAFDLFHAGHVEILRIARQLGDFLLVGVHTDQTVSEHRGTHPVMHLHERSLSVLACRYVDEVIIGAPREVTKDMIMTFNMSIVVHGTVAEGSSGGVDPYAVPKSMGIFKTIESPRNTTSTSVARRIMINYEAYKKRNEKKGESEKKYYAEKKFVVGD